MGKQVDLVMYNRGKRFVLGRGSVGDDGNIQAQVAKDMWPTVKELFQPGVGEITLAPANKS